MRYVFSMLAIALFFPASAQKLTINPSQNNEEFRSKVIRCDGTHISPYPLIVIDGFPCSKEQMRGLDASQIESIEILKGNAAIALYGSKGTNGVVIISTKCVLKFIFHDVVGNYMVAGATVKLFSGKPKDTVMYVSDSSGFLEIKNIKRDTGYGIIVSAVGYEDRWMPFSSKGGTDELWVKMTRKYIICQNVVVNANKMDCLTGKIRCLSMTQKKEERTTLKLPDNSTNFIRCFPDPLPKGQTLHLEWSATGNETGNVRLLNAAGVLVASRQVEMMEGTNRIDVPTDGRFVPGVYFVMLYDAKQQPLIRQKVVIQ